MGRIIPRGIRAADINAEPAGLQIGFDQADGRVLVDEIGAILAPVRDNGHV